MFSLAHHGTPSVLQLGKLAMKTDHEYWFPAKRYGWGWGLPTSWEGWLVCAAFLALIVAGVFLFPPARALGSFITYTIVVGVLLLAVCWLKGEPPRWRWGDDQGA
jgi:drug/metabolite transporter (DMT)-like permease